MLIQETNNIRHFDQNKQHMSNNATSNIRQPSHIKWYVSLYENNTIRQCNHNRQDVCHNLKLSKYMKHIN
jgi:hypothetical protein